MSKPKNWRLRHRKQTWGYQGGEMILDDHSSDGGYNHPTLVLEFRLESEPFPYQEKVRRVRLKWQRNLLDHSDHRAYGNSFGEAQYRMDTCKRWSGAYAGHVELEYRDARFEISRSEYRMSAESEFSILVARTIAETIAEYNLALRNPHDQAMQAVEAVEKLAGGCSVAWKYRPRYGEPIIDLYRGAIEGLGANRKHAAKQVEQAEDSSKVE